MPSPDVAAYLGLVLVEVDAQELVDTALADAVEKFPDWTPREGHTAVVLLEENAAISEEQVYAINRQVDGTTEVLLRLFGLTRDVGAPPTADVTFTLADDTGHTIPAGTTVRISLGDNVDPVDLATVADLTIDPGDPTGTVTASGATATLAANGIPASTSVELLDAITYVDSVQLATDVSGGRLPEDGAAFIARTFPTLDRLTTTLVRPVDVETYVGTLAGVTRVRCLDLYNPYDVESAPGASPGYVTVAVAGPEGSSLTSGARAAIKADLVNRMHAGLTINVIDADVTTVDVDIRVLRYAAADDAATEAAVVAAVTAYLDPDTWPWSDTVRVNELIAAADRAAGVDTVIEVSDPAADIELDGFAPLAKVGTVTVTVDAPA